MARKTTSEQNQLPRLIKPRVVVAQQIQQRIQKGIKIKDAVIQSEEDLARARQEKSLWSKYNAELLRRSFDNVSLAEEYERCIGMAILGGETYLGEDVQDFKRDVGDSIDRLQSILERLELIDEVEGLNQDNDTKTPKQQKKRVGRDVFVVHGHDKEAKESVARFISKLGLTPVILHEMPNASRVIIEKLEDYSKVDYAIVLLTPDDIGGTKETPSDKLQKRARQNVILELGLFLGLLGRKKVCALHKGNVEIPTDYRGVLFIPMDSEDGWRLKLAQEIKHAGLEFDMNKAIG